MRVVSLVPSVTETLLEWGIEPIACTRFCEQPSLRHVGGTKDPDIASIATLAPDVVIVDREENRREDATKLIERGLRVVDLHVTSLDTAVSETNRLASIVGVDRHCSVSLDRRPLRACAFVPIWRRPWMTINAMTYGASLLESIGVGISHPGSSAAYPEVSGDELSRLGTDAGVDVVLLPTEPYAFAERHVSEIAEATGIADVRIIDGRDLFWWGVRTEAAQERLAKQLGDLLG